MLKLWTQSDSKSLLIIFLMRRSLHSDSLCFVSDTIPVSSLCFVCFVLDLYLLLVTYLWLCQYGRMPCVRECPVRPEEGPGPLKLELYMAVSCPTGVLGIEHGPTVRAVSTSVSPPGFPSLCIHLARDVSFLFFKNCLSASFGFPVFNFTALCSCFIFLYFASFGCDFAFFFPLVKPWSLAYSVPPF